MNKKLQKTLAVAAMMAALGISSGCSNSEIRALAEEAKATADRAAADAGAAKSAADAAAASADEAKRLASNAQSTANRAAQAASEAQSCCAANTDRIERMFRSSMSK
jgi:hypothetical protein